MPNASNAYLGISVLSANRWNVCNESRLQTGHMFQTHFNESDTSRMLFNAMVVQVLLYDWKYGVALSHLEH